MTWYRYIECIEILGMSRIPAPAGVRQPDPDPESGPGPAEIVAGLSRPDSANFGQSPAGLHVWSGSGSGCFNRTRSPVEIFLKIIAKITKFGRNPAGLRPDFMSGLGLGPAVLTGPGVRCRTQTRTQSPAGPGLRVRPDSKNPSPAHP